MTLKSARRGDIPPFIVMEMLRLANERAEKGDDILHLELGEPFAKPPLRVVEAAKGYLDEGLPGYTASLGIDKLRQKIARFYKLRENLDVASERIVITTGSSGGFVLSFLAAFDPGDRVALVVPGYPAYSNILSALDVVVVPLVTDVQTDFQPTAKMLAELIAQGGKLDGLIIASPSNPTGTVLGRGDFKEIVDLCREEGIRLISDEIYHGITYDCTATSALHFGEDAIVINSFSKYFAMPGWRLGWMVVPQDLMRSVESLAQNLFISPPCLSQYSAMEVFDCLDELDANVAVYARNRKILLEGLPKAGFDRLTPAQGAFYIYADVSALTENSNDLCHAILEKTGVAVTPGVDFDPQRGRSYVRFSFAGAPESMTEAVGRLTRAKDLWRG